MSSDHNCDCLRGLLKKNSQKHLFFRVSNLRGKYVLNIRLKRKNIFFGDKETNYDNLE